MYAARIQSFASSSGVMTLQISQRGKEYLKTAQTLRRTAKTVTDDAIAAYLKALAVGVTWR
jgi:hypothetical protein